MTVKSGTYQSFLVLSLFVLSVLGFPFLLALIAAAIVTLCIFAVVFVLAKIAHAILEALSQHSERSEECREREDGCWN